MKGASGVCVVKGNKVCFHPADADSNPTFGILREFTTVEYERGIHDYRAYDINDMEAKDFNNPENEIVYKMRFIHTYPEHLATATCSLYWSNTTNFDMKK